MNIKLVELILESVPMYYKKTVRSPTSTKFTYGRKEIIIDWHLNGQPWGISYLENRKLHRQANEGPAFQAWYDNGQPGEISYYENSKLHRPTTQGPALQTWHPNGQPDQISYAENGVKIK